MVMEQRLLALMRFSATVQDGESRCRIFWPISAPHQNSRSLRLAGDERLAEQLSELPVESGHHSRRRQNKEGQR